jgi:hypothetical protein
MSFTVVAVATSIASLVLGLGWLFAGGLVLKRWQIEANSTGLLVGRRLGAVYLSMAVLLFVARSAPSSEMRTAVCVGLLVALTLLAALGLFELKSGRAGKGILVSVGLELVLAAGFLSVLLAQ